MGVGAGDKEEYEIEDDDRDSGGVSGRDGDDQKIKINQNKSF